MLSQTLYRYRVALMAAGVGVFAAFIRFVGLGYPTNLVFDEVFYVRGAYSLVELGFEGDWSGPNQAFAEGDYSGLATKGDFIVHPMVGKLLIAAGIQMFGPTPYGWRFSAALLGTVTVVLVALIGRHLLGSTIWGGVAGVFLAIEGEHVVLSRTALLDIFLTFFVVAGFGLILLDRARSKRLLFERAARDRVDKGLGPLDWIPGIGPGVGIRWWRLAAILTFGLAVGVKWSGLYYAAAFLVMSVIWDWVDRRDARYERWFVGSLVRAIPAAVATIVLIPVVYVATWWPWFRSEDSYGRHWAENNPGEGIQWLPESLRSLVHYHDQMWEFHVNLTTEHNYESNPLGWIIQLRPTAFHWEDVETVTCYADRCVSAIHAVGHPLIWLPMVAALGFAAYRIVAKRDWTALAISLGILAGWLPWLPLAHRTIFTFYTVVMAPFVVLLVVWACRHIAKPERLEGAWSRRGTIVVTAYVAAVIILGAFFLPVWTGSPIPYWYWQMHMWSPTWV